MVNILNKRINNSSVAIYVAFELIKINSEDGYIQREITLLNTAGAV